MSESEARTRSPETADPGPESASAANPPSDWKDALPEELRDDPSLASIKDLAGLAKSYVHSQRLVGRDKVALPGKDAGRAEILELMDRLGRPETPDGYRLDDSMLGPELHVPPDLTDLYRAKAHELGLLPEQAEGLFAWFLGENAARLDADRHGADESRAAAEAELQREFGPALPRKLALGLRAASELGGAGFIEWLEATGLGNAPEMIRFFVAAGEALAEDQAEVGERGGFGTNPADARAEIARLQTDGEFRKVYTGRGHPGHDEAVDRMTRLFQIAYPDHRGGEGGL